MVSTVPLDVHVTRQEELITFILNENKKTVWVVRNEKGYKLQVSDCSDGARFVRLRVSYNEKEEPVKAVLIGVDNVPV